MILEEAILHAEEVADRCAVTDGNIQCENEHRQLAEWLKDYKRLLKQEPILEKIRAEIEQVANKQFKIAMGIADLNERYTHIQMENAYRHSLNIIDKYRGESDCRECKAEHDCYECKKYVESEE